MLARTPRHIVAGAVAMVMLAGACAVEGEGDPPQGLDTSSTTVISAVTSVLSVARTEPATTSDDSPEVESTVDVLREVESTVDVELADYAISVEADSVPAGLVTLSVLNQDSVPHDVVVVATDLSADQLPTNGIRVDESSSEIEILARTPSLQPGTSGSLTARLIPGRYALVCMVPHHYVREMMVAVLIVT